MAAPLAPASAEAGLAEKVRFLSAPGAYAHGPATVRAIETHMHWVFLTGTLVYKLKKPVRFPFLDFSTLGRRRHHCAAELRLNQRLAGDVYRRLLPLVLTAGGGLSIGGEGTVIEWLIEMVQLPDGAELSRRLVSGTVGEAEVDAVAEVLCRFYAGARPQRRDGRLYLLHLREESAISRRLFARGDLPVTGGASEALAARVEALVVQAAPLIRERVHAGHIVEGHGDLRPEHVWLVDPPQIIDCLEFDRAMRLIDPYDEVDYLGMECALLGAPWIGPRLHAALEARIGHPPEPRLRAVYAAFRAMLRARISLAHLLDAEPMEPGRWPGEAARYLAIAEAECLRAGG